MAEAKRMEYRTRQPTQGQGECLWATKGVLRLRTPGVGPIFLHLVLGLREPQRTLREASGGGFSGQRQPQCPSRLSQLLRLVGDGLFHRGRFPLLSQLGTMLCVSARGNRSWQASIRSSIRAQGCHLQHSTDTGMRSFHTEARARSLLNIFNHRSVASGSVASCVHPNQGTATFQCMG